jgi:hypothetical protein
MADAIQARVVEPAELAGNELSTVIRRDEVERALAADEPPEMQVEVIRAADGGDVTAHAVSLAWDREALEELLHATDDEDIALRFDADELDAAVAADDDVEAHGLRERAAVLAVAATAAAGLAGQAPARPLDAGGGSTVTHGLTAKQIWSTAPPAVRRAAEQAAAARAAALRSPAPFHATSDSGSDVSTPSAETAGAIAGAALMIAAVGFGVRRQRPQRFA